MERWTVFMDWKNKLKCKYNTKQSIDPMWFLSKFQWYFLQKQKNNPKIWMEPQRTPNNQSNSEEEVQNWSIMIPDFKLYSTPTVIKTVWFETIYWMGESICKWYDWCEFNIQLYKQLITLKKTNNLIKKKRQKNWLDIFPQRKCRRPTGIWKDDQYH